MHSQLWQSLQFLALLIHTRQQLHITLWEWNNLNYNPLENDQILLALHWLSNSYAGHYGGKSRNADARFSCSSILLFLPSHVSCRIFSKQLELCSSDLESWAAGVFSILKSSPTDLPMLSSGFLTATMQQWQIIWPTVMFESCDDLVEILTKFHFILWAQNLLQKNDKAKCSKSDLDFQGQSSATTSVFLLRSPNQHQNYQY